MIIASNSFFGFNIYKRTRLYEKKLTFEHTSIHCDDIGLYVIGEDPNLEYNFVSLFQKKEWDRIALETLNLAFLNLIVSGTIDVYKFEDEKAYLNKLIKNNTKSYFIKIIAPSEDEDLLTQSIVQSINKVALSDFKIKDLKAVITVLLDNYLNINETHSRPEKSFIINMLKFYSKQHDWISITSKKKLLGLYKDYKVDIKRIYIPRINMQHQNLKDFHRKQLNTNQEYVMFRSLLRDTLRSDFKSRLPDDSDVD